MTTEVELKYLVLNENVSERVFEALNKHGLAFNHQIKHLCNCYFDTANLAMRQLDMGLRVRSDNGHLEQTIKTAGIVVGGLHQRPEYNVDIDSHLPTLALFPANIWPESQDIAELQSQLIPLFTTDFKREIWLVTFESATIELAFDQGEVTSQGQSETICEIELELVTGDRSALFAFAALLFASLNVRAGLQSKAARGYRLFANQPQPLLAPVALDIKSDSENTNQYFLAGVSHCLQRVQWSIEQYLQSQQLASLADVVDSLFLLRHGFWLFNSQLQQESRLIRDELSYFIQLFSWIDNAIYLQELMSKTGNYRKKLEYSAQLIEQLRLEKRRFPDHQMITELLHSDRFNLLQLNLLRSIVGDETKQNFLITEKNSDVKAFAKIKLSTSLQEITQAISALADLDAEQYLAQRKLLQRSLLTGNWFGYLFSDQERMKFRTPWLDLLQGLRELKNLWIIKQQLEKVAEPNGKANEKIISWQQSKVENLLSALSQTKAVVLSMPSYWLDS